MENDIEGVSLTVDTISRSVQTKSTPQSEQSPEIILTGRNLGKTKTRYFGDMRHLRSDDIYSESLNETFYKLKPTDVSVITQIETIYQEANRPENDTHINGLTIQEGKVVLNEGQMFHKINKPQSENFDDSKMTLISKHGIIASEWFGIIESEGEGHFCSFFDTFKKNNDRIMYSNEFMMTIDYENPDLQKLLKLDFFKYLEIKDKYPELVSEQFSEQELAILNYIENISPGGIHIHSSHPTWKAIPGGIPAKYINGICIDGPVIYAENVTDPGTYFDDKTNRYYHEISPEKVKRLSELFPNATIFRRDQKVLYQPQENPKTNDLK